ncbi:nodulin homeobox isoform X1 [Ziziphus jujuba]|uniref:Nodulin homeobox isoform X1 n=2 Tax=Ziziphus jujuba TaxID=326968 RepID=A0A6P4AAA1_ZIZJJ|nr:nodulin homeobox isoform X1 [Ziziphus jujuba]
MRHSKEEASCSAPQVIDLISAVRELNGLSSQDLNILLRDSENFTVQYVTEKESLLKIDMEKLAASLPLHLIAVLMSSDRDEALLRYLLCGIRFLHSLCDLAPRHAKLEQILLDDVKVSEQLLDMTIYMLIVLACYEQENHNFSTLPLLHSTLVACSLHLLTACISSQWQDLVHVLLAHPKVDIFMDAAFGAVCVAIKFLEIELSTQHTDFGNKSSLTAEQMVNYLCQQCEASLQFLQSLCQQKLFRERLLSNKELCGKGGVLFLAQAILKLNDMPMPHFVECARVVAAVSRLKAKVLSILLSLCEAESISYLDEVASSPGSLDLAKSVSLEILELLKTALGRNPKHTAYSNRTFPMGFLQLNAMRLADIFSDDSNFRSYITVYFTKVLTAIFSLPHGDFLSTWCSSELPVKEEDGSIEYDSFAAAGWVLDVFSSINPRNPPSLDFTAVSNNMSQASYAHQRTSLFVKVIANLHCFVPTICEEQERNLFLNKFMECLQMDQSDELPGFIHNSHSPKAPTVCRNLRSLLSHAESLIPNFLNEEDLQLLRVFFNQLQSLLSSTEFEENRVQQIQEKKYEESISWDKFAKLNISEHHQEAQSAGGCSSPLQKEPTDLNNKSGNLKEEMCENSAFQDADQTFVNEQEDQGADAIMEDKGKSGRSASGGMAEIDRDAQNVETSGSDTSTTRGKNAVDQMDNGEFPKSSLPIKESGNGSNLEDEKVETVQCEEKQRRKRKRTIMNDKQISLIERALVDEPEMQRNAALVQSWADKLSSHGSEVTSSQLKNWLNNRKARLARTGRDHRATLEGETSFPDKQVGPGLRSHDTPESPGEDANIQSNSSRDPQTMLRSGAARITDSSPSEAVPMGLPELQTKPGQYVMLVDSVGEEIGKGRVFQVHGQWYGRNLEELRTCVIDVKELKAKRGTRLPYPCVATGVSFEEAVTKIGVMRVMWDANRIFVLRPK